jgi:hypothetical protein
MIGVGTDALDHEPFVSLRETELLPPKGGRLKCWIGGDPRPVAAQYRSVVLPDAPAEVRCNSLDLDVRIPDRPAVVIESSAQFRRECGTASAERIEAESRQLGLDCGRVQRSLQPGSKLGDDAGRGFGRDHGAEPDVRLEIAET